MLDLYDLFDMPDTDLFYDLFIDSDFYDRYSLCLLKNDGCLGYGAVIYVVIGCWHLSI
jgi:hypothetical protein